MFSKKTINDYPEINGKTVLLRADYNVPLDEQGHITGIYRLTQSVPTIQALQAKDCKIVIISHLGRPKSSNDTSFSLRPVAKALSKLLKQDVQFIDECIGQKVQEATNNLSTKDIVLLENLRFHPEEKANDSAFAKNLVKDTHAEIFVQDGFGVVHRAHASTDAVPRLLPALAGLLVEKEVDTITNVMSQPKRPLMAVIGGAKIADKIDIIDEFIHTADILVVGGAMANTFLAAQGVEVGESLIDTDEIDVAHDVVELARKEAKKRKFIFYLPQDGVVAERVDAKTTTRIVDWDAHVIADIEAYPARSRTKTARVAKHEKILDIGPYSGAFISGAMQLVETVVWNGTMGVSEIDGLQGPIGPFAHGTEAIIDGLVGKYGNKPFSVVGGGDTAAYVEHQNMTDMFDHVSTGGGASLELMGGKELPGISVLWGK